MKKLKYYVKKQSTLTMHFYNLLVLKSPMELRRSTNLLLRKLHKLPFSNDIVLELVRKSKIISTALKPKEQ